MPAAHFLAPLFGASLVACSSSHPAPMTDAGRPCAPMPSTSAVDLLFVVDNSNDMAEQQSAMVGEFQRLFAILSTGDRDPVVDRDGDGAPDDAGDDFDPLTSIHVGFVTSDMGTGGFNVMTCNDEPNFGDDGVLQTDGNTAVSGCMATYPTFLELAGGDAAQFARDAACLGLVGTGGCGMEQPLEAMLKAIAPSTCTDGWCRFQSGTGGHADVANAGFLRPDSVLALVMLTNEDDCSAADTDLFNTASVRWSGELSLRCFLNPTAQWALSRYADGLLAQRPAAGRLVYSLIAGVPPHGTTATATYAEILALPEMEERIDPTMMTRLTPSCRAPEGGGNAFPPRRLTDLAATLDAHGAHTSASSICDPALNLAFDALIDDIEASRRTITCE